MDAGGRWRSGGGTSELIGWVALVAICAGGPARASAGDSGHHATASSKPAQVEPGKPPAAATRPAPLGAAAPARATPAVHPERSGPVRGAAAERRSGPAPKPRTAAATGAQRPGTAGSGYYEARCRRTSWDEIAGLFEQWNAALATHDPDQVVARYARDAVLLPTLSNTPRTDPAEIRDYFDHFLAKSPHGRIDRRVIKLRCNVAADAGLYTFTLHERDGRVHQVAARYSFVYEWRDGRWQIVHHHSSAMPEGETAAAAPQAQLAHE